MVHGLVTHGMSGTPLYKTWARMLGRCRNKKDHSYGRYGKRGIRVCKRWDDFEKFAEDMGNKPYRMTLERKNNNGRYSPKNCKWATTLEQNQNRRTTFSISFKGKRQSIAAWARIIGVTPMGLKWRLDNGWSKQRALTEKPSQHHVNMGRASVKAQGKDALIKRSFIKWKGNHGVKNRSAHKVQWH